MGKNFVIFFGIVAVLTYLLVDIPKTKEIHKSQYGQAWAFTSDMATLKCYNDNDTKSPVIIIDGKSYGLTGFADNLHGQSDTDAFNAVWLDDPTMQGMKVNVNIFTKEALQLCD